ncbi:heme-degrading domain-containing protein [Rarobacter faecitabidus]|uniref:Uncharacterized protein (UPF0303 family) n=1 Tax=Rarobacter faecitabidus TaxID=13243 RepID=A0A542ZXE4_RARFA|nr:heme-binding protein [Rarobacter faecitabidus]TQL65027.1 uncharacterized protein (UPF0303 family) [Rarobacter faecitabidus]
MGTIDLHKSDWSELTAEVIETQEREAVLPRFSVPDAHWLGRRIVELSSDLAPKITVSVRHGRRQAFLLAGEETVLDNEFWIRRKINTVERLGMASLRAGRRNTTRTEAEFYAYRGLDPLDYVIHGGAFPIHVDGVGLVGVVAVSGLSQEVDHTLAFEGLIDLRDWLTSPRREPSV